MKDIRRTHTFNIRTRLEAVDRWIVPPDVKADVYRFIEELGLGKVNIGRRISEARQVKCLNDLRCPLEFFAKPISAISVHEVEAFEKALATNHLISRQKHRAYADTTKADIRQTLKVFLRWKRGPAEALRLAGWIDTRLPNKTPDYLSEEQVERLLLRCRTAAQRFTVAVLFDAGARAAEFLNIRYEDIQLPGPNEQFVKVTLREEYSKTKGRTISLCWRYSLAAVREYLSLRVAQGITPREPVFNGNYGAMRMFLKRLARRVLKKEIQPRLFRNSSATFYASKLNHHQLCYRYGWQYSSEMPDVYISRAGMENKEADERIVNIEMSELRTELARRAESERIKDERIVALENQAAVMDRRLAEIAAALELKPTPEELDTVLHKRKARAAGRS